MNRVFLGLGVNLGDRLKSIDLTLKAIENDLGPIKKRSSLYQTKAWGKTDQPDFLNMVVEVSTTQSAIEVLKTIQKIETDLGRIRIEKWGARVMDIDILFFNNDILNSNLLTIPHPLLDKRRFVLTPFAEIAEKTLHPILNKTIGQLLTACTDELDVLKLN